MVLKNLFWGNAPKLNRASEVVINQFLIIFLRKKNLFTYLTYILDKIFISKIVDFVFFHILYKTVLEYYLEFELQIHGPSKTTKFGKRIVNVQLSKSEKKKLGKWLFIKWPTMLISLKS